MADSTTSAAASQHAKQGHSPIFLIVIGLGFVTLFIVALMTSVQTNEAYILGGGHVNVYKPNWNILMQMPNLILGNLSANDAKATIWGWGIELIYLGFVIGYEALHNSVQRSGQIMAKIFKTMSWILIGFNGWTDFNYGNLASGFWGQVGFALITSFIVAFFGTIGLFLIEHGLAKAKA